MPKLADRGQHIASESSFCRVLQEEDQVHHRGRAAVPKKLEKTQAYKTAGPNQIWIWDITYMATTVKGIFFYLYLILDIYSRKIVGWKTKSWHSGTESTRQQRRNTRNDGRVIPVTGG